jgi:CubicO group peptidase (beta-lactamase class C family)
MLAKPPLRGFVRPGYEPVRDTFAELFSRGWDIGSAFTAYVDGERVVHLQGGVRDPGAPDLVAYDDATLQLTASASKFVESLAIALLVDRGLLRYDDHVVDHWPGFALAGSGKAAVTVRQLMMHRAGLPVFDRKLADAELFDVDARARFLERQAQVPELFASEPTTDGWQSQRPAPPQAYHAVSRGLYTSELTRRVDPQHRTLGAFVHDELTDPLDLPFWIGLPQREEPNLSPTHADAAAFARVLAPASANEAPSDDPRYALHDYEREFLRLLFTSPDSLASRALNCLAPEGVPAQELARHRKIRECELPSSNGIGAAWALAALASLIAEGGAIGGRRIFSGADALRASLEVADHYATDAVMLTPVEFTQGGFSLFRADDDQHTVSFGWGGAGGQMVRVVPELGIGCAYLTNTLGVRMAMNDPRPNALLHAVILSARRRS